jgi:lysophospholipase L1-like esterase
MVRSPTSPRYSPHTNIILITPPPVNTYQREAELAARNPPEKLDRDFEFTRQYAEAVKSVGLQETVPVVDAWTMMYEAAERDERNLERFLWDGLHLRTEGYKLIYESLMKTIGEHYPELHHDNLQFVFPSWQEIDWRDPFSQLGKRVAAGSSGG